MPKPLLSVCLITYNQVHYVQQAIDSVLAQEVDFPWEIIIADDNSTDGTKEILQKYHKQHPDLIRLVLQKRNVGPEKNWIELINTPKAKYMAYLEGDDYWTSSSKLQKQVDFLEEHDEYALCFHPTKVIFEDGKTAPAIWPVLSSDSVLTIEELLKENFIPSNAVVYRRRAYNHLPPGVLPGDWYLHLYQAQFGKIGYLPETMSVYRRHSGGLWWESHNSPDTLWIKYGISMLLFQHEIMRLYGEKAAYQAIIRTSIVNVLSILAGVDKRCGTNLIRGALEQFPEEAEYLVAEQTTQLQTVKDALNIEEKLSKELSDEVVELRGQVFSLRNDLHALTNARLLGRIIKLRDNVGTARKLPRKVTHQARVIGAPLFPGPVRRSLKRAYRAARRRNRLEPQVTLSYVDNKVLREGYPLVSVVIPYYNRADTIDDTIDSLRDQTFQGFEVLLVNDGSTDQASIQKLEKLKAEWPKLRINSQENQGVAKARNYGIGKSRGRYIICLDSDDMFEPTFIEKATVMLEANPGVALATTYRTDFGVLNKQVTVVPYDPIDLYINNMVISGAQFRKEAWEAAGGYKSDIGYEDWEFWLSMAELGYWGRLIPETLFRYRTALQSRFNDDKEAHWNTIRTIHSLHPKQEYRQRVKRLLVSRRSVQLLTTPGTALINMHKKAYYIDSSEGKPRILITIPWMTFGGAETLIYNYCRQVKDDFQITFMTGLKSKHEWEYKFKEITPYIYHLANLFDDEDQYVEFISNYIDTREIDMLHVIHNGFTFRMLETLKARHPRLKIVVTMFNDRVEYFEQSIRHEAYIDGFVSDNQAVAAHYKELLTLVRPVTVIPNGLNCYDEFNPELFNRTEQRKRLGIKDNELAVFFVGRLSVEKNPDVFLEVAEDIVKKRKIKGIKFLMIGSGPMDLQITEKIKELDDENIIYLGYQSEMPRYFNAADIFVLPSSIEGFPLSIIEAMAMGVAVVASDVGAVADVVEMGRDGFVVPAGSATDIVARILELKSDPKILAAMKRHARQDVETKYSNVTLGRNYRKMYRERLS